MSDPWHQGILRLCASIAITIASCLVVVVEHGKGDMSLYGYNQSALVSVGSQVRAGQPIALVGSSGGQGRPSLYFEIRRQGQAVNPQPWLGR